MISEKEIYINRKEKNQNDKNDKVTSTNKQNNNLQEAVSALQVLGYPQKEAMKAVNSFECKNLAVEDIIKKALLYFTKK